MSQPAPLEPTSAAEKLHRLLAGDERAAAWLYDTFAPRLYRRLTARYGYPGGLDADDLLHDAFVVCFRNRGRVIQRLLERVPAKELNEVRLERFLWDQACGVASNRLRAASHKRVVSFAEVHRADSRPSAEQALVDRDVLGQMLACLERSGGRLFLYFKLRFVDGLRPREIAQATNWSQKVTYNLKQSLNEAVRTCAQRIGISVS